MWVRTIHTIFTAYFICRCECVDWKQFVSNKLYGWEVMNLSWARNFTGSLKIVHYNDLVQHLEAVLRSILEFLEIPINEVHSLQQFLFFQHEEW